MTAALPPRPEVTYRYCVPCGRRDAAHVKGKCAMEHTHPLRSCRDCGRPVTDSDICSDCRAVAWSGSPASLNDLREACS